MGTNQAYQMLGVGLLDGDGNHGVNEFPKQKQQYMKPTFKLQWSIHQKKLIVMQYLKYVTRNKKY